MLAPTASPLLTHRLIRILTGLAEPRDEGNFQCPRHRQRQASAGRRPRHRTETIEDEATSTTGDGEQLPGGFGAAAFDAVQHSCEARSEMGSVVCSGRLELTDVPVLQSLVPAQVGARSARTSLTFHRLTRRLLTRRAEMKARLSMSAPPPTASLRWTTRDHRGQQTGIRQHADCSVAEFGIYYLKLKMHPS
ncbi:Hypothetical predicted protein [Cloeon dipterum]|uniref:Uncharacterized protein n=1 Tax=Cloeon dipterum TaxID=197152 RepID=A0A8S1E474_9INSE|nr:Hypothetical predicted protein [Cloeon dipterum]